MGYTEEAYSRWLGQIVQPAVRDTGEDLGGWQEFVPDDWGVAFISEVSTHSVSAHTRLGSTPALGEKREKKKGEFDTRRTWIESGLSRAEGLVRP